MFGLSEKVENNRQIHSSEYNLLYIALFCFALIISSFIISSASASANVSVQNQVSLTSEVFVIRSEKNADGVEVDVLKTPNDVVVIPGDKLKFILSYRNETGQDVEGFKATNPMPGAVQFSEVAEDWAIVSIDGGKNWGKLSDLIVKTESPDSETLVERAAGPADVTHVRWVFGEIISVDQSGTLSFEGVVK